MEASLSHIRAIINDERQRAGSNGAVQQGLGADGERHLGSRDALAPAIFLPQQKPKPLSRVAWNTPSRIEELVRLLVWNLRWARPKSPRGRKIRERIQDVDPDIAVLTETGGDFLTSGHTAYGTQDWGYPAPEWRRKVVMWSKNPWNHVDPIGSTALPGGRYVSGSTTTGAAPVRCIGVCIPWRDAHVRSGRKDRKRWEDHLTFLQGLGEILKGVSGPCILAGDWNQRIPRKFQPKRVRLALDDSLPDDLSIHTSGVLSELKTQVIDHAATTNELSVQAVRGVPKSDGEGGDLSDHHGVIVDLKAAT